jgi:hypothetical protein
MDSKPEPVREKTSILAEKNIKTKPLTIQKLSLDANFKPYVRVQRDKARRKPENISNSPIWNPR